MTATLPAITEKAFQAQVVTLARALGWRTYHTHFSFRSDTGYPDLTLVKPGRLIFAELKTEKGKATAHQEEWLEALREAGAEAFLWRPSDWDSIVLTLGGQTW